MQSNSVNPMRLGSAKEVVEMLQAACSMKLNQFQFESAEIIVSTLGDGATISDFVHAARTTPDLVEFGTKVGAFCLPGEGYAEIFANEYGSLDVRQY